MKHEKFLSGLVAAVLSFGVAWCGVGCVESAFPTVSADMAWLGWFCAGAALFCSACFSFRRGGWVFLCAVGLVSGFALAEGTVLLELESLVSGVTRLYATGYGWPAISWSGTVLEGVPATGGLALLAVSIITAVSWTLCRCDYSVTAMVPGFLPLALCLVLTDTVPDTKWLFWLLASFALILLTHPVRYRDKINGLRLTAWLLIPALLFSMLLFGLCPENRYESQSFALRETLLDWFRELSLIPSDPGGDSDITPGDTFEEVLDLSKLGPKLQSRFAVMKVISSNSELLYLRGQAMDVYTGTAWAISDAATGEDPYWPAAALTADGTVTVELQFKSDYLYFPYYGMDALWTTDFREGALANLVGINSYRFQRFRPLEDILQCSTDWDTDLYRQCLSLPEDTARWAGSYLTEKGIYSHYLLETKLNLVTDCVRASARYDLNTRRMPEGSTDFVRWFLEESDTGYCTHYASAATVLLRALGVPARLVSGYTVRVVQGVPTTVTADKAHAWVEYLDPQRGWTVLDPTPGEAIDPPPTEPPVPTQPITKPTEPTQPTEATETTAPTVPETSSAVTEPIATQEPHEEPPEERNFLLPALIIAGSIMAAVMLLAGQYGLRRRHRRKIFRRGDTNAQALARWHYASRLCKLLKLRPSQALWTLAEKAAFSQHTLTRQELEAFDLWISQAHDVLRRAPWPKRLWLKLIFAIG